MIRFVATADWQLGMTRHFLSTEAQARFTAARLDAIATIAELATDHDAAFVIVAGDVFESNQVPRQIVTRALTAMGDHPDATTRNHAFARHTGRVETAVGAPQGRPLWSPLYVRGVTCDRPSRPG